MHYVSKIITLMLGLIALYLVLVHGTRTASIIGTIGQISIDGIEALQGRS